MLDVHICDDHILITKSVRQILEESELTCNVTVSHSRNELFETLRDHHFDIIIMDLNIHGVDMMKEIDFILDQQHDSKLIVLSVYDSIQIIDDLMKKGVHGFLSKNVSPEEILECISVVLSNRKYISREHRKDNTFKDNFELLKILTEREVEVLKQLTKGYTNKKIATELSISINTVQTHRKNIYSKLELRGVNELVAFAYENNLYD